MQRPGKTRSSARRPALPRGHLRLRLGGGSGTRPCLKHRPSVMGNDIAANGISCKPQKLQAMFAVVELVRGSLRKTWLPCHGPVAEPSWIGRGHEHWRGVRWQARPCDWRERWMAAVQPRWSGWVMRTSRIRLRGRNAPAQIECPGMRRFRRVVLTGRSRRVAPAGQQASGMTSACSQILP